MKIGNKKRTYTPFFVIIVGVLCFISGLFTNQMLTKSNNNETSNKSDIDNKTLIEVYNILKNDFYDSKVKDVDLIKGLVNGTHDKHTLYMTKDEFNNFDDSINGHYEGIGINYVKVDDGALITNVFENSLAYKGGLKAGDIISEVSGVSIKGKSSKQMENAIRGEKGTILTLTILREGVSSHIKVERGNIDTSVFYHINNNVGYIDINTFGDTTVTKFKNALDKIKNCDKIIIDLRDNGGGYVDSSKECLEYLVSKGKTLYSLKTRNNKKQVYKSESDALYSFKEGYILVNEETASASEIMASALQYNNGYKVIGNKTYGKSTSQVEKPLSNGSVLKYTYASWFTSNNESVKDKGVNIDINVDSMSYFNLDLNKVNVLKESDLNDKVITLSRMLKALGYNVDRCDGYFSFVIKEAVMSFQQDEHIEVSGEYNEITYYKLLSRYFSKYQSFEIDEVYKKAME